MTFQTLLLHPAVRSLGWALLHFIWQGTLLAALFFVADTLTRPSQSRLRYAIGCMTMLLMLLVFGATIFQSHPFLAPASSAQSGRIVVVPGAEAVHLDSTPVPPRVSFGSVLPGRHSPSFQAATALPGFVVCLWLGGIVALSICTACGWIRVRRLRRRGVEPVAAAWIDTVEALMQRLQVSRPVRLYTSAIAEVPMVIGFVRPYILFPVSAITGLSESQLRAVLAHELAHIRRHDYLANLLQTAVETLLFYHPAVWWLSRRVRQEREHCCDDLAVEVCGDVMEYAGALAQLEELRGCASEPALAATGGDLLARIRRLMEPRSEKSRDRIPGPLGVTLSVALVLGAAIGVGHTPAIHAQSSPPRVVQAAPVQAVQNQAPPVPAPPAQAKMAQPPTVAAPKPEVATSQEKPAGKLLEFEVASIKPFERSSSGMILMGPKVYPGGRVEIPAVSLKSLIQTAFHLSFWQVSGGNDWMDQDRYDVAAKAPQDLQPPISAARATWSGIENPRLREMLQALLIDRFQLRFHRETKTGDVFVLQQSGKTLRLRPRESASPNAEPPTELDGSIGYAGGEWGIYAGSMAQLAKYAALVFHAPVVDRTELSGLFDYKQKTPDVEPTYGGDQSASFGSFLSECGLKLERSKGPVEVFAIDYAAKPSPN